MAGETADGAYCGTGISGVMESDAAGNFDIWVMNADGAGLTQLTDSASTDWSPDWMWVAGTLTGQ